MKQSLPPELAARVSAAGEAYKGGPNSGVFMQVACDHANDLSTPRQKYTFDVVKAAQARDTDVQDRMAKLQAAAMEAIG